MVKRKELPTFPIRPVPHPERRQERLVDQYTDAPKKGYEKRARSIRVTKNEIDPSTWLRNQYMNDDNQMVCQICKNEMPFRKRDGNYYFEAVEVLFKELLTKEHEVQYLALCPLCAAMYNEFIKCVEDVMTALKEKITYAEDCEVQISLGEQETSIRFVETHFHDLKVIICDTAQELENKVF